MAARQGCLGNKGCVHGLTPGVDQGPGGSSAPGHKLVFSVLGKNGIVSDLVLGRESRLNQPRVIPGALLLFRGSAIANRVIA